MPIAKVLNRVRRVLKSLIIRIAAKAGINRIEKIYTLETADSIPEVDSRIIVRTLSCDELEQLAQRGDYSVSSEDRARVASSVSVCFGAFLNGQFAGVGWYALRPYHHSDGIVADFQSDWLCGYGAYVSPEFRGQGIRYAIVREALGYAHAQGRRGILAAINWDNEASLKSGVRMGYQPRGYSAWWPAKPFRLSALYHLRFIRPERDVSFSLPNMAVITPFYSSVLETAFASTKLSLVIDCGSAQQHGVIGRLKNCLRSLTGRDSSLEDWARRRDIPYIAYRKEPTDTVPALSERGIELLVSYAAPLLPEVVFSQPRLGTVNLHPSLLPKYRGGRPLFWQVFENDMAGGVTLHKVDAGIDTGTVLSQRTVNLTGTEQRDALGLLVRQHSANLLADFIWRHLLNGRFPEQDVKKVQKTRFANQISLNQLLVEFPIEDWPLERMVRVAKYLGYWPPQFGLPLANNGMVPIKMARHGFIESSFNEPQKQGPYILSRPDGWVEFTPTKSIKAILKHRIKSLRKNDSELTDIYL